MMSLLSSKTLLTKCVIARIFPS